MLQVHCARVLAAAADGDLPEQAQRGPLLQCVAHHVYQEQAVGSGARQHVATQAQQQVGVAMHGACVEEHAGQHQRHGIGAARPMREVFVPARARLAPLVGHGHDLAGAVHVAAGIQPIAHQARKALEVIAMRLGPVVVGQHQAVVLVCACGLLHAPLRAGGHPGVGHGWGPQLRLGQLDHADGKRIGHRTHDDPGAVGAGFGAGQAALQVLHAGAARHQASQVGLAGNFAGQVHRRGVLVLVQVGRRHHAQQARAVQHRQVVDVLPRH